MFRIGLPGVAAAVRLKRELLRQLSRSSPEEWRGHIDQFIDQIAASGLEDATALWVLLADLLEEIRVLLSQEPGSESADSDQPPSSRPEALSRSEIVTDFSASIHQLLAATVQPRESLSPLVARMLRVIEERYAEPLTLDVLTAPLGRTKRYLATLFHQQTGHTVHGFLTQVRMHHAAALIRAGEKIEAVSLLVGYRSKKNFYRHFKEQLGVTPVAYRTTVNGLARRR